MTTNSINGQDAGSAAKIFISYSRKDMTFVDRLERALVARGFEPLIDRTEIHAFEDWWKRIEALIGRSDTVAFVLSPDAVASDVALKEIAYAASLNKRLAPIVWRRTDDSAVPEALRRLNFVFFGDPARFEASANQLAEALNTDIGWVRQHTEYGEAARKWAASGRAGGLLLRSPALDLAEYWISSRPRGAPVPDAETQEFVAESRQGALSAQRNRRLMQIAIYTLLLGIIAGLIGWIKQEYIKEQINWYLVMRPYAVTNFWPYVLQPESVRALTPSDSFRECAKECPEMIVIPAGKFTMGSPGSEEDRFDDESPQHIVTIEQQFAVSKFDVTVADWDVCVSVGGCAAVSKDDTSQGPSAVVNVSWDDALQYVAWLSKMTGQPYRLLTEAEWEYAARAGSTTAYYWGDKVGKRNANCSECDGYFPTTGRYVVGSFKPNAFGLYDMAGNSWQWVQDCYHNDYNDAPVNGSSWANGDCSRRVVRGGSFGDKPQYLRSAARLAYLTYVRSADLSFRVARTLAFGGSAISGVRGDASEQSAGESSPKAVPKTPQSYPLPPPMPLNLPDVPPHSVKTVPIRPEPE